MENWADFATLAVGTDGALTAQWFQTNDSGGQHSDSGWFARSTDAGATWSAPAPLSDEFVALAPLSGGRTLAIWLESTRKHDPHAAPRPNAIPTPSRQRSDAPRPVHETHGPPAFAHRCEHGRLDRRSRRLHLLPKHRRRPPGDRVFVAYRGHTPDEIRDNKFTTFDLATATWSPFATLKDDGWNSPARSTAPPPMPATPPSPSPVFTPPMAPPASKPAPPPMPAKLPLLPCRIRPRPPHRAPRIPSCSPITPPSSSGWK